MVDHTIKSSINTHVYEAVESNVGCRIQVEKVVVSGHDRDTSETFQLEVGDAEMRSNRHVGTVYATYQPRLLTRNELVTLRNTIDEALL